jgi:hypothetical protein
MTKMILPQQQTKLHDEEFQLLSPRLLIAIVGMQYRQDQLFYRTEANADNLSAFRLADFVALARFWQRRISFK